MASIRRVADNLRNVPAFQDLVSSHNRKCLAWSKRMAEVEDAERAVAGTDTMGVWYEASEVTYAARSRCTSHVAK